MTQSLSWTLVEIANNSPIPLPRAHCSICTISSTKAILFGGLVQGRGPSNDVWMLTSLGENIYQWRHLSTSGRVPNRSHHTGSVIQNQLFIIGGTDGRMRYGDVHILDLERLAWSIPQITGSPPVGLSSHTTNVINDNELLVIGRQGGVRTQRRFASVFKVLYLREQNTVHWIETNLQVISRSGHLTSILSDRVFVWGGRRIPEPEFINYRQFEWTASQVTNQNQLIFDYDRYEAKEDSEETKHRQINECKSQEFSVDLSNCDCIQTEPRGLQSLACLNLGNYIMMHGGESFISRDSICGDTFCFNVNDRKWYQMKANRGLRRSAHCLFVLNQKILCFGGKTTQESLSNELFVLTSQ